MSEITLIDEAIALGLTAELLAMLEGSSKYSDVSLFDRLDKHSKRLRDMTILHLKFVVEFKRGLNSEETVKVGKIVHSSFPQYFEAWKLAGIPGISTSCLDGMVNDFRAKNETTPPGCLT